MLPAHKRCVDSAEVLELHAYKQARARFQASFAGGGSPSIQDAMAHADAALHQLKAVTEKESLQKLQSVQAAVQRKEAELQVCLMHTLSNAH